MTGPAPSLFFLPLLALVVVWSLPAPAETGIGAGAACGPGIAQMSDPGIRAEFERIMQRQSHTAARICHFYRNSTEASAR